MEESSALAKPATFSGIVSAQALADVQRTAKLYSSCSLVPREFQGQEGYANTCVIVSRAWRLGMDPLDLMQNSYVIHGRVVFSSPFVIAIINGCGRFEPLRYEMSGKGDDLACYAVAKEKATGKVLKGPTVTMAMAKAEGWATKNGNKWRTMPELMIQYRSATFWGRLYASDVLLGIQSRDEIVDIEPVSVSSPVADLNAKVAEQPKPVDDELF